MVPILRLQVLVHRRHPRRDASSRARPSPRPDARRRDPRRVRRRNRDPRALSRRRRLPYHRRPRPRGRRPPRGCRRRGRRAPRVVAFFDLDHTIIDTNSNKHWVSREVLAGRVTPKLIGLAIYWFTRYAMGQGAGAEAAGAEAAMAYAGKSERQLRTEVETMFDEKLAHRMRPGCGPTMAEHVARGDLCVMCTSSWQYAAQYAARLFGCETAPEMVISSVMEEKDGKLTGGSRRWRTVTASITSPRRGRTRTAWICRGVTFTAIP